LHRPYDLDSALRFLLFVICFDNLAKSALAEKLDNFICYLSESFVFWSGVTRTSICQRGIGVHDIVPVIVINLLVLVKVLLPISNIYLGIGSRTTHITDDRNMYICCLA
jgi:hypothetical protein